MVIVVTRWNKLAAMSVFNMAAAAASLSAQRKKASDYWDQVEEEHLNNLRMSRRRHAARLVAYRRISPFSPQHATTNMLGASTWVLNRQWVQRKSENVSVNLSGDSYTYRTSYFQTGHTIKEGHPCQYPHCCDYLAASNQCRVQDFITSV